MFCSNMVFFSNTVCVLYYGKQWGYFFDHSRLCSVPAYFVKFLEHLISNLFLQAIFRYFLEYLQKKNELL